MKTSTFLFVLALSSALGAGPALAQGGNRSSWGSGGTGSTTAAGSAVTGANFGTATADAKALANATGHTAITRTYTKTLTDNGPNFSAAFGQGTGLAFEFHF